MVTLIKQLLIDGVVLFVFSIPLIFIARRSGRADLVRKFLRAGAIVAGVTAGLASSSEHLVNRCFEAGNHDCVDIGAAGIRLLLIGGYIVIALAEAYLIAND